MDIQTEYYIIGRENNNSHPLLSITKNSNYERKKIHVENPELMLYRLGKPVPAKPIMVDYHSSPSSVISQKIYDVLKKLNIKGIQLIPATITGKDDEIYENYWFINIFNKLPVLDKQKSTYKWDDFFNVADPINKLFLSEELLTQYPLEDRLVFRLAENSTFQIYHKSVVDAIMAINPEGVRFTSIKDWSVGTPFD